MKWLLITTRGVAGGNPGDQFALVGTQNLIKEVDPQAEFDTLNKECGDAYKPRAFDRAVICGMPLFWSTSEQTCSDIWWWDKFFNSWISKDKNKLLALGVGHVLVGGIHNLRKYIEAIQEVMAKTFALSTREPLLDHPRIVDTVCPSAYAIPQRVLGNQERLCNFMVNGGHFSHLPEAHDEAECWKGLEQKISDHLRASGFKFVAHNKHEAKLAEKLGWSEWYQFDTVQGYLDLYARSQAYIGNRMHGAAVCASVGTPTMAIGYDSRLGMVTRLGGLAVRPTEIVFDQLDRWLTWEDCRGWNIFREKEKMLDLLTSFARQEI